MYSETHIYEADICTCISHGIRNCVTQSAGQVKLIFAAGVKLTVNSGGT